MRVPVFANKMTIEAGSLYISVSVPKFNKSCLLSINSIPGVILKSAKKCYSNELHFTARVSIGKDGEMLFEDFENV
jgi:hypothetical protein